MLTCKAREHTSDSLTETPGAQQHSSNHTTTQKQAHLDKKAEQGIQVLLHSCTALVPRHEDIGLIDADDRQGAGVLYSCAFEFEQAVMGFDDIIQAGGGGVLERLQHRARQQRQGLYVEI